MKENLELMVHLEFEKFDESWILKHIFIDS